MGDPLEPRAVERNKRVDTCSELTLVEELPHASKVSLAFFTDSRNKINRALRHYIAGVERPRKRKKTNDSADVVADSRRVKPRSFAPHAYVCALRENRIEVCGDNDGARAEVFEGSHHIADIVSR